MRTLLAVVLFCFALTARADCFDIAARRHNVGVKALRGIALVENRPHNRWAVHHNRNGTVDIGIMQVNSAHLPELRKLGIKRHDLFNVCRNIDVAARYLHQKIKVYGYTYRAVGAYHVGSINLRNRREAYRYIHQYQLALLELGFSRSLVRRF